MDSASSSLYSESILNGYLNPSHTSLTASPADGLQPPIPEILICNEQDHTRVREPQHATNHPYDRLSTALSPSRSLNSACSSSNNSMYSSVSNDDDWELDNLHEIVDGRIDQKLQFQASPNLVSVLSLFESLSEKKEKEKKKEHRHSKLMKALSKDDQPINVHTDRIDEKRYFDYINEKIMKEFYSYSSTQTLHIDWDKLAQIVLFGDTFEKLFYDNDNVLFYYLRHGHLESGDFIYENFLRNINIPNTPVDLQKFLTNLLPDLSTYDEILELYASSSNTGSEKLFDTFKSYTTFDGFNIPLAHAMFGNWLLSYNKDTTVENNYDNEFILKYFRKAARLSLVVRKLVNNHYFDHALNTFAGNELLTLKTYLNKHNTFALSIALHNFGEFYQVHHAFDISINLWELNCHLTKDSESGNLAILVLTNGFGFGNKYKTLNRFGKKSKTNKFNTKRRIAHIYRILIKDATNDEVGTSWVWKEKYD